MTSPRDAIERFNLRELEALLLEVAQIAWMWNDAQLDGKNRSTQYFKRLAIQDYASCVSRKLITDDGDGSPLDRLPIAVESAGGDPSAPWIEAIRRVVLADTLPGWLELSRDDRVMDGLRRRLTQEDRAALVVIELAAFSPWGDNKILSRHESEWDMQLCQFLAAAPVRSDGEQAERLIRCLREALDGLGRGRKLGRAGKASVVAGGLVVGGLTGGWAAPAVGGMVGGALGYGGAAATNAGLALLGGGSLAAGGLGMAGGTALVTVGAGAAGGVGAGVGSLAVRLGTPEEEVAECAKLVVLVSEVVIGINRDAETARLIFDRLRSRLRYAEDERDATDAPKKFVRHAPPATRRAVVLQRAVDWLEPVVRDAERAGLRPG